MNFPANTVVVSAPCRKFVFTPAGSLEITLAIAACRHGGIGVLDTEFHSDPESISYALARLASLVNSDFGLRSGPLNDELLAVVEEHASAGLSWLIVSEADAIAYESRLQGIRATGVSVLAEISHAEAPRDRLGEWVDGLLLKGNEAGGFVGELGSFLLFQRWHGRMSLPLYLQGGITPHSAAAVTALGAAGVVLDSQLLLLEESPFADELAPHIQALAGNETIAAGEPDTGCYFRFLLRPTFRFAKEFAERALPERPEELRQELRGHISWSRPTDGVLPVGQDVCFAGPWRDRYGRLSEVFRAIDEAVADHPQAVLQDPPIAIGSALAKEMGTELPIVQGPMTRVSDRAAFAGAVAKHGALPMIAAALMEPSQLAGVLEETRASVEDRPWGIGLLGFAPQELLDAQIEAARPHNPTFAIIAGGRPDQAVALDNAGIPSFLHVPSANLLGLFLGEGARRFIFEGRECGGHIGPLNSFVLWSSMVDRLLNDLEDEPEAGAHIQVLFAGGIHDALSSAAVQVLAAPLLARGVRVGVLMGSAYLFTREIVEAGAIVAAFQDVMVECERTVSLESGPGHASCCAFTPFAHDFFAKRREQREAQVPADQARQVLDDLILGRLRIASKGIARDAVEGNLVEIEDADQRSSGMYMAGQVVGLRDEVIGIAELHDNVSTGAAEILASRTESQTATEPLRPTQKPLDIAIVGIGCLLPGADGPEELWENLLAKKDAITEIPDHRWDWRLYFDEDPQAPDKIYSKWGGFLDDLAFDPMRYGIPPRSLESVDPMQLMALEVAHRTLADAGYAERPFDRRRASVILGASGGTGDVGMQYGLRAELPRFHGELPSAIAERLPEWTEDTFAGILINVLAGRIANRLDFGGVNYTTDAACASSLAAVYQAVSELESGRSDLVLAGGVDTVQGPFGYLCFSKTQALSPRGRSRAFDASADGIVISEGIAMVALKRLEDAERDGDRVYTVIRGIGGGSDGGSKGLTAPLPLGQTRTMSRAYERAGFGPETVALFEAHGTGTVAGDTSELRSTTSLLQEAGVRPRHALVSSIKTMIGHTKATAGVAGLVKAALSLQHKLLPPQLWTSDEPNEVLRDDSSPLYQLAEAQPWLKRSDVPRRAAVSSFGFGGTNFHAVLEEYSREYRPWLIPAPSQQWSSELCLVAAKDRAELIAQVEALRAQLEPAPDLALRDLAAALAHKTHKTQNTANAADELVAIVASDFDDLARKFDAVLAYLRDEKPLPPADVYHRGEAVDAGKVAVLFSGQGSQYPGMCREIGVHFPLFADVLADADEALADAFDLRFGEGVRLSHFVHPRGCYGEEAREEAASQLTRTDVAQPALGTIGAGLWQLLQSLGIRADMVAGHSYGEFTALYAAGAFDFSTLMMLSEARGRSIVDEAAAAGSELGTMAAVQSDRATVEAVIADIDDLVVANHNAPEQSIVSGSHAAVERALALFDERKINATSLDVAAAFHSRFVEPARARLAECLTEAKWCEPGLPVYSNTTGEQHQNQADELRQVMTAHLVEPVEFEREINAMYRDGARVFVELGPKAVLTRLVDRILDDRPHEAIAIDGNGGGVRGLLNSLARLMIAGVPFDSRLLFEGRKALDCDPTNLAATPASAPIPPHAWWVNGSGVRRVSEPPRQIGVRADETHAPLESEPRSEPQAATPLPPAGVPLPGTSAAVPTRAVSMAADSNPQPSKSWETSMQVKPPKPDPGGVMADYFDMMRQFLESQEKVMTSYLGATPSARDTVRSPRPRLAVGAAPAAGTAQLSAEVPEPIAARPQPQPAANGAPLSNGTAIPGSAPPLPGNGLSVASDGIPATNGAVPSLPPTPEAIPDAAAGNGSVVTNGGGASVNGGIPNEAAGSAPANGAAPDGASAIDGPAITEILYQLVDDKTGYPRDMVGVDQNLEADLGIDSIKRVEIIGALLQILPDVYRDALGENLKDLNRKATLNEIVDMLIPLGEGGATVPFDRTGAGEEAAVGRHPLRYVIEAENEPLPETAERRLEGGHFVVTEDTAGISDLVCEELADAGCSVHRVEAGLLGDEGALHEWCEKRRAEIDELSGIVHLGPLCAERIDAAAPLAEWHNALVRNEKSLFLLLSAFGDKLKASSHVVATSSLGGNFGRDSSSQSAFALEGGSSGLLKSLLEEQPGLRVKAIDLDPSREPADQARAVMDEVEVVGGRQEVGYPGGLRTVFRTREADALSPSELPADVVVLATGGAKGITAESIRPLARAGNTLVITGRSPNSEQEPEALNALLEEGDLRNYFIAEVRAGRLTASPADIQRRVRVVMAQRELRNNLADLRSRGAHVEYHAVDVTDEQAMHGLIDGIYERYGAIHVVVHGAGVIEDRLIFEKTSESWSRVVETKVLGLVLLQRFIRPQTLRSFVAFSSVAGRYGNSGQGDYATANELMNRLCGQFQQHWGRDVTVKAICWGPWGPTEFGAGMASPDVQAKFAEKGVIPVAAESGRALFASELFQSQPVEVVLGVGPWEEREADLGRIRLADQGSIIGPILGAAQFAEESKGVPSLSFNLGPRHRYLEDHLLDGKPVLPAAVALEAMAEGAAALWPDWKVVEVRNSALLKGIEVGESTPELQLLIDPATYGSADGFEVDVKLVSEIEGKPRFHYRAVVRLEQRWPADFPTPTPTPTPSPGQKTRAPFPVERAYDEWLFHGRRFQVIRSIEELSTDRLRCRVDTSDPRDWLGGTGDEPWIFDPGLLDAAAQAAILWARSEHDAVALPARFGRVVRFTDSMPEQLEMFFEVLRPEDEQIVTANVYYTDSSDRVVMSIEDLECIASPELKRLCGTAPYVRSPGIGERAGGQ